MAKSKSQQATNLAKQYTADQLAAAMIYGETRAGVDAKGNMADQLAGVRELRTADNRAKATGKDIGNVLTQKGQYQGLSPQSLKAITNPDSLKNPGDRAAARAALDKAKDYFAGKYEGQVGKGTPYENVTSFNKASEAYNTKKSGAIPGSHVAGGEHNFFTTTDMAKRLQQAQAARQQSAPSETIPIETPSVAETSGKGYELAAPAGTVAAEPAGKGPAAQELQGSYKIARELGPMGQRDDESSDYGGRYPAFPGTGTATPLYQVPKLDPYSGSTLGAGNVANIPSYAYSSPNKNVGQGQGQGQGTGTSTGASQGTGAGLGDGTIGGGGYGSSGDLPSGYGDGTIAGGGYADMSGTGQLPSAQQPQQGPAESPQMPEPPTPPSSGPIQPPPPPPEEPTPNQPPVPEPGPEPAPNGSYAQPEDFGFEGNVPSTATEGGQNIPENPPYVDWSQGGEAYPDPFIPSTPPPDFGAPPPLLPEWQPDPYVPPAFNDGNSGGMGSWDSGGGGGWDSGGYGGFNDGSIGGEAYGWGGGGEAMFAKGGNVKSHVYEALRRTKGFASGGSVVTNARMLLSKKASSHRGRPD